MTRKGNQMKPKLLLTLILPIFLIAQSGQNTDVWGPLKYFIGKWEGQGEGRPGISKGYQEFCFVLSGKYLEVKNRSVFEPQERNPKGEIHEDWGFISYDQIRKKFVFRQFHVEGFVNQYVLETISDEGKTFVFVSEHIENIPEGFKARLTYKVINDDEFLQSFDLAGPGKEYECYSTGVMKRKSK